MQITFGLLNSSRQILTITKLYVTFQSVSVKLCSHQEAFYNFTFHEFVQGKVT